jgi:hypothetical protein
MNNGLKVKERKEKKGKEGDWERGQEEYTQPIY